MKLFLYIFKRIYSESFPEQKQPNVMNLQRKKVTNTLCVILCSVFMYSIPFFLATSISIGTSKIRLEAIILSADGFPASVSNLGEYFELMILILLVLIDKVKRDVAKVVKLLN